jgi:UDP-N-acetylmuramoylalanine--D-glutamate ligase
VDLSREDLARHAHAASVAGDLRGRRVLVVGMARSGVAAARLAVRLGARVTCTDARAEAPRVEGCDHAYGGHVRDTFLAADLIVVSPGVPARQTDLAAAAAAGVPLIGELAFAAAHLTAPIFAISGTNGKSTTTHLLGQMLANAGMRVFVGGNIGRPLSEAVGEPLDAVVVEVSSYMMELPGAFRPRAAVVLNLTPDHLERHGSMDSYGAHKCRIFARMGPDDVAIVPAGDARLLRLAAGYPGTRLFLDSAPGVRVEADRLRIGGTPDAGEVLLGAFALPGAHNRANLAAAVLLAVCAGVPRASLDLGRLSGLPHRLEPVAVRRGVTWINDSKATNVDSTLVALAAADLPRTVVLLGGKGKDGAPYDALVAPLRAARRVVCFGAEGPRIAAALEASGIAVARAEGLDEAVTVAAAATTPGDTVLLSPACASFDQFTDFENRGRAFRARVEELPE